MAFFFDLWRAWQARDFWIDYSIQKLRARYSFSILGTSWVVFSFLLFSAGMAYMHNALFGVNFYESFLYVSSGFLVWTYVTGIALQSASIYREFSGFLLNSAMNPAVPLCVIVFRNLFTLALQGSVFLAAYILAVHNGILEVYWTDVIVGGAAVLVVLTLFGFLMAAGLALIALYLPDIDQLLGSLIRFLFFLSPIIWPREPFEEGTLAVISAFNPFAASVVLSRIPLHLVESSSIEPLMTLGGYAAVAVVFLILFYGRFRRFISVWI